MERFNAICRFQERHKVLGFFAGVQAYDHCQLAVIIAFDSNHLSNQSPYLSLIVGEDMASRMRVIYCGKRRLL